MIKKKKTKKKINKDEDISPDNSWNDIFLKFLNNKEDQMTYWVKI